LAGRIDRKREEIRIGAPFVEERLNKEAKTPEAGTEACGENTSDYNKCSVSGVVKLLYLGGRRWETTAG